MPTAAERLAEFVLDLSPGDIPAEVTEAAKYHLLDTLGCGLAASALGIATEGRTSMAELGGDAQATVIGAETSMPAANAAFANAMLCHGLDFDDTHSDSVSHVSVVTWPTALAVGEWRGASGADVIAAVVAANEVVTRVGMAASGAFHARGFHPTAVCGIFGATAAASRLGGLDQAATTSAYGLAGSKAAGIFAYLEDGTATKPVHPAWASHGGILASRLAAHGAQGPPSVFEGKFGLYHSFVGAEKGEIDLDAQLADLGSRWETPRIAYKPYPACHFMHGSLGATAELVAGNGLSADDIESVIVTVPEAGVSLVLEPATAKVEPRSEYEGKFSLQYSTASMIVNGKVEVATYSDEALRDPDVLALAKRVTYETPEYATYPAAFPGGVRITLRDGRSLEADHAHQLGGPDNPMSPDAVQDKYRGNARLALDEASVDELEAAVLGLDRQESLTAALAPLTRARAEEGALA